MNLKSRTTHMSATGLLLVLLLLTGCGLDESTLSKTRRQVDEAQERMIRKLQEQAELEARLQEAQKAREQAERHLKDTESTITRQDRTASRAERGLSLWRAAAAFFFVLAVVLLFVGAAAGSAIRKEVTREENA